MTARITSGRPMFQKRSLPMPGRHSPESAQTVDRYAGASSGLRRMANRVSQLSRRAQRARRACVSGQRLTKLITVISRNDDVVVVFRAARLGGICLSCSPQCEDSEKRQWRWAALNSLVVLPESSVLATKPIEGDCFRELLFGMAASLLAGRLASSVLRQELSTQGTQTWLCRHAPRKRCRSNQEQQPRFRVRSA